MQSVIASNDDELLALAHEYDIFAAAQDALWAQEEADSVEEERIAAWGRHVGPAVAVLPATTIEGMQAKLRIVAILLGWDETSAAEQIAAAGSVSEAVQWSILRDLQRRFPLLSAPLPFADRS